ncbi:MAG TPA: serine/threonine-protein kinase [Anaerolineales bacterium]|nr:serine/threonine-protein kinase [Anaerolineales bacterium]
MLKDSTLLRKRYRIVKLHEMGRENPVYRAYDEILRADVAIKENAYRDETHQHQFKLEGVILANLIHPNIPRAFDFLDENGRQFIIMDFIEGINLQQLMQQRKPATEEILDWAVTLCDVLAYLHSRKPAIIHRDVEPSNIILANNDRVLLVDFGFAKIYQTESEVALQKHGIARTDTRSDQYSLAATIYWALTGAPPVDSMERVMQKAGLHPIRPGRPDLPDSAEEAIFRALSIEPDGRFSNLEDFKSALQPEQHRVKKPILKFWG